MGTWPEAKAVKAERVRRERRYFTPDLLGKPCRRCQLKLPLVLGDVDTHPCCDQEAQHLIRLHGGS